jgi:hypothetical protein
MLIEAAPSVIAAIVRSVLNAIGVFLSMTMRSTRSRGSGCVPLSR